MAILREEDTDRELVIVAVDKTTPAFAELLSGALDGNEFVGPIPLQLEKQSGISIKQNSLIDLTTLAMRENPSYHASAHPKEASHILLWHQTVSASSLDDLNAKFQAHHHDGDMYFKLVELQEMWKNTTNSTALASILMYQSFPNLTSK